MRHGHEHGGHEVRVRGGREGGRERDDKHPVEAECEQQAGPVGNGQELRRGTGAREHVGRVRVEGDGEGGHAGLAGLGDGGLHEGAVPRVHAVERAERADRGGERCPLVTLPERVGAGLAPGIESDAPHAGDGLGQLGQKRGLPLEHPRELGRGERTLPRGPEGLDVSIV